MYTHWCYDRDHIAQVVETLTRQQSLDKPPDTCFMVFPRAVPARLVEWISGPHERFGEGERFSVWLVEDLKPHNGQVEREYTVLPDDGGPHTNETAI